MRNIFDKRIPTLLAVLLLAIGVGATSYLVQQRVIIFQNAAPPDTPQNIRITNISDSSFTVTYTTVTSVIGTVTVSEGSTTQTILDDRDEQSGVPKPYTVHSISIKDLKPDTTYSFKILSGTTTYLNADKPFTLTTAPQITGSPNEQNPLAGKIVLPSGEKPQAALIFATTDNGQLLSTLLNPSGLYILPLNTMRTKDLSAPMHFTSQSVMQLLITDGTATSNVSVGIGSINPVPPITLSQNYDFTMSTNPLATGSAQKSFPIFSTDTTFSASPEIIVPKSNQSFTDTQPQFSGTALPNKTVSITIHSSNAIQAQVTTNAAGNWTYRPTTPLTPGKHTITITTADQYGILKTIEQSFVVYAAGSEVNQSATPSATLAPTATPTPTATTTPIPTRAIATTTPTIGVTISPTTPISVKPSPRPTLPSTGSNTVAVLGIGGLVTTVVGIVLFLITSGATL